MDQNFGLFIKPNTMQVRYKLKGSCSIPGWTFGDSSGSLVKDEWNHVAMTFDGSKMTVYINGVPQGTTAFSGIPCQSSYPIKIGAENAPSTPSGTTRFTGSIDEVEIYPRALNAAEIQRRYGVPAMQVDLQDRNTWNGAGVSCPTGRCPTVQSDGAHFDQKQHLSATVDLSGDAFTFATWVKPEPRAYPLDASTAAHYAADVNHYDKWTDADYQGLFGYKDPTDNDKIYPSLFVGSNGRLRFVMGDGANACEVSSIATGLVTNNEWQQVTVTHDGTTVEFYVNGKKVSGGTSGSCATVTPPVVPRFYIGRPNETGYVRFEKVRITHAYDGQNESNDMEIRLNWWGDRPYGYIWGWDTPEDTTDPIEKYINLYQVLDSDATNRYFRFYENEKGDWNAYDCCKTWSDWKYPDDNWVHITGLTNISHLATAKSHFDSAGTGDLYWDLSNDFFQGTLDDFRVYQYALGADAVADLYKATATTLELNLDEPPGATVFADTSGNGVTVSCSGDTCPTSGIAGRRNQALDFDGKDDFLTLSATGSDLGFNAGSLTAMMWIRPRDFRSNWGSTTLLGDSGGKIIGWYPYGRPYMGSGSAAPASIYNQYRWIHLAFVYEKFIGTNRGPYRFYVDGVQVGRILESEYPPYGPPPGGGNNITIGKGGYFNGLLDDLTIYRQALTQAQIRAAMNQAPLVNLHLDEDFTSGAFVDTTENRNHATCTGNQCPKPGDKGQIRESSVFSDSLLTVANSNGMTFPNFTVGLWVKPTDVITAYQPLITKQANDGDNRNFGLFIKPGGMQVHYSIKKTAEMGICDGWVSADSTGSLREDQWNHVMMTYDGKQTAVYINGSQKGTQSFQGAPCLAANPIKIGGGNNASAPFSGGLDEVVIYANALSEDEIFDLYTYQAAWFDVINHHDLTIDADAPTVDLSKIPSVIGSNSIVMYIGAEDATSQVTAVAYRVDGGDWITIPMANTQTAVPLFYFTEVTPGVHTVEARATDSVGNEGTAGPVTVVVDSDDPQIGIASGGQQSKSAAPVEAATVQQVTTELSLNGTISDTASGITPHTVQVTVYDHTGASVSGALPATLGADYSWQAVQSFSTVPYGVYTVTAVGADDSGNTATASDLIQLDGLDPYADVISDVVFINPVVPPTLGGVVSDVPYPSNSRQLHLHFEAGLDLFSDASKNQFALTCSSCPTTGGAGVNGDAASFDGSAYLDIQSSALITNTTVAEQLGLNNSSFTVLGWVKASDWSGENAILGTSPIEGLYVGIQDGSPILGYGGDDSVMTGTIPTAEWVHLVWRYDQTSGERAFFINGMQTVTATVGHAVYSATETIQVGRARGGNGYDGLLDELVVYGHALPDETIYDIANPLDVGIANMQARFRPFGGTVGQHEGDWYTVTLASNSSNFTTWQAAMPGDLELGGYKLDLLVTDGVSNSIFVKGAWSGSVISPSLAISKTTPVTQTAVNQNITYTLTYTNNGAVPVSGVLITETIPADTRFNAAASAAGWSCTPAVGVCTYSVGDLAPGTGGAISFTLTVTDTLTPGTVAVDNTAIIDSDKGHIDTNEYYTYPNCSGSCTILIGAHLFDSDESDNTASTSTPMYGAPDLQVTKDDGGITATVMSYDAFTYTITYTNTGSQAADARLIETLPPFVQSDPHTNHLAGWVCSSFYSGDCTYDLGILTPGASGSVPFVAFMWAQMPDVSVLTNTVTISDTAGAGDLNYLDNTATITTPWTFNFGAAIDHNVVTVTEGCIVTNTGIVLLPSPTDGWWLVSNVGTLDFDPSSNITWTWTYTSTDGLDESQTISLTASDDAENYVTTTFQLIVENVAPTVVITGANSTTSGSDYTLTLGSVVDPGDDTVTACQLHWGDGVSTNCLVNIGGSPSLTHVYTIPLVTRALTVALTDEDGVHTAAGPHAVFVAASAPSVQVITGTLTADEGDVVVNGGLYGPTGGGVTLNASEGTITGAVGGAWTWSFDTSTGAEITRSVTITASNDSTDATAAFTLTVNGDGVDGPVENGAPNSGDGNNDGAPDRQQGHVASVPVTGGGYVTLAVTDTLALRGVAHTTTPPASMPEGLVSPYGFINYQVEGVSANNSITVAMWLPDISAINAYYQYGPTPDNPTPHWYEFKYDGDTETGALLLSDRIVLYFVDGQRGDHDLTANGVIVHPGVLVYALPRYELTTGAEAGGIEGWGAVTPTSSSYISGTVVPVTATAGLGWSFDGWSGDLSGTDPTQSVTMDGDQFIVANFSLDRYTLETNVVGLGELAVDPVQDEYLYGASVNITVTPATGWVFAGWSGDLSGTDPTKNLAMASNIAVTATFTAIPYTVTASVSGGNGTVTRDPDQASYIYGDVVMITANPDPGYELSSWSGDLSGAESNGAILIDGDKTITAAFSPATYTVDLAVVGSGQITVTPQKSGYDYGDEITLTATADLGWSFDVWLAGPVSNTAVQTMTMNDDVFALASFAEDAYTLTVTWEGSGEISLAPFKPDYTYGEVVTATAVAAQGYQFDSWGGDCAGTGDCVVTMDGAKIVTATFALYSADLSIAKTATPATPVNPGGTITYTLAFSNVGNIAATGVVITDELPAEVTVQGVVSSGVVITLAGSAPHVWQVQDLDGEGQGGVITITALLDKPLAAGTFTNTAEIAAASFDVFTGNNSSSAPVAVLPADLVMLKTAPATRVKPGGAVTYTLTFSNAGPGLATGVVIADAVPVSVTNPSAASAGDVAITLRGGAPYTWDVDDLAQGQGGVITITGWLSDSLPGGHIFMNTAEIATTSTDSNDSNDSSDAAITVANADLEIVKTASNLTPDPNGATVYTITVTNSADSADDATGVVVSDTLPLNVTLVSSSTTQGEYANGVWDVGGLNVNASAMLYITAEVKTTVLNGTFITNTAVISAADQGDSNSDNNRADRLIVVGGADLALVKTVNDSTPNEEDAVAYAITVTNHGSNPVSGVVVSDTLPLSVTPVSSSTTQGDYADGVWDVVGGLVDGASATLHVTATVDVGAASDIIANTAVISETSRGDPESSNDVAVAIVAVQDADAVVVTVTPGAGGTLTYTDDTRGLTITVEVPPGAVTDPVNLVYLPLPASTHPAPDGMRFVGSVFTLDVYDGWMLSPGYVFDPPIIITIHYSDEDVAGIDEETLVLEYWNGTAWEDAACDSRRGVGPNGTTPYDRHPDENWLAVPLCHLSEFALFGTETLSSVPVGGYTEPLRLLALLWPLILLAAVVIAGVSVRVARKRRAA